MELLGKFVIFAPSTSLKLLKNMKIKTTILLLAVVIAAGFTACTLSELNADYVAQDGDVLTGDL